MESKEVKRIGFSKEYNDIYSIEYKGIIYINLNYNAEINGKVLFDLSA
jgi:hypothetical protein